MTRTRWLQTTWPFSMRTLAARLKELPFGAATTDGFRIDRARDEFVQGQHFEKLVIEEIVRDPFGQETTFSRLAYRTVDFVFSATYPHIELRDYPRSVQTFLTRTSQATDFTIAFQPIKIDPFTWATAIRNQFPKQFRIDIAHLADIVIEEDVTAKMVLASHRDIRAAYTRFINRRPHTVDRIQVRFEHDDHLQAIQLAADGTLRSTDVIPNRLLEAIRNALSADQSR